MAAELTIDGYAKNAEHTANIGRNCVTYRVSVSQVGGGIVGNAYDGDWIVTLSVLGRGVVYSSRRLTMGKTCTHSQVAYAVVNIATSNGY